MAVTTGLSGNEIYCLDQKGLMPGNIVVGNSVHALGFLGGVRSGVRAFVGGELEQVTSLIEEGRTTAFKRMVNEAGEHQGITGVTSELIFHSGNIEFLAIGTAVKKVSEIKTISDQLPPQAIVTDRDTFFDSTAPGLNIPMNVGTKPINTSSFLGLSMGIIFLICYILFMIYVKMQNR